MSFSQGFTKSFSLNTHNFLSFLQIEIFSPMLLIFPVIVYQNFLSRKSFQLFMPAAYIQVHFSLDFIIKESTMYPDQTATKGKIYEFYAQIYLDLCLF